MYPLGLQWVAPSCSETHCAVPSYDVGMSTNKAQSSEEIEQQNVRIAKQIEAHRAALIENNVDPDSWDGSSYGFLSVSTTPARQPESEASSLLDAYLQQGAPVLSHPCEHIIQKLEERNPNEDFNHLRYGAEDAAYAGIEYGDAPATPESRARLMEAETAEIHRLNHLSKEAAQHVRRGGGRPSTKQRQRTSEAFQQDVQVAAANSEPWDVMIDRIANEIGAPITPEQFAMLSHEEQFIFRDQVKTPEKS